MAYEKLENFRIDKILSYTISKANVIDGWTKPSQLAEGWTEHINELLWAYQVEAQGVLVPLRQSLSMKLLYLTFSVGKSKISENMCGLILISCS